MSADRDSSAVSINVVVFGASRAGKSAVLRGIHERLGAGQGQVATGDATAFVPLDWLALDLGIIGGRAATVMLYAVPGMTTYDATRRMLLAQADGVLFIADSQAVRLDANIDALRILREQLGTRDVPIVYFLSKHDLPTELLLGGHVIDKALTIGDAPSFAGDAIRGSGVREALQALLTLVLRRAADPGMSRDD